MKQSTVRQRGYSYIKGGKKYTKWKSPLTTFKLVDNFGGEVDMDIAKCKQCKYEYVTCNIEGFE